MYVTVSLLVMLFSRFQLSCLNITMTVSGTGYFIYFSTGCTNSHGGLVVLALGSYGGDAALVCVVGAVKI